LLVSPSRKIYKYIGDGIHMTEDELTLGQEFEKVRHGIQMLDRISYHLRNRFFDDARKNRSKMGNYVDPLTGFKSGAGYFDSSKNVEQIEHQDTRELYEHIHECLASLEPANEILSAEWRQLELRHRKECMERLSQVY